MIKRHGDLYEEKLHSANADSIVVKDRLIVKTKSKIDTFDSAEEVYGLGYAFIQYDTTDQAEAALAEYKKQGLTVQRDMLYNLNSKQDTYAVSNEDKWAYLYTESDTTVSYFKYKKPSQVIVGIIDSGIEYTHSLLKSRIIRSNINFSGSGTQGDELDDEGHGTSCAGIIAQATPDNVKIEGFKAGDSKGNIYTSNLICTYEYILSMNEKPDIINMSYGGYGEMQSIERELMSELYDSGIVLTASAGNENRNVSEAHPANLDFVMAVSAFDRYGKKCTFSNYGDTIDIAAPGVNVYTSYLNNAMIYNFAGTSASAPFVSAAAAIVLMQNTALSPAEVRSAIKEGAYKTAKVSDRMWSGSGLLNYSNLIDAEKKSDVEFNYESGEYSDTISVELSSPDKLNTKIIYTTDGSLPSKSNGTTYSKPIEVDSHLNITAAAFPIVGSALHSRYTSKSYRIFKEADGSDFEIDDDGTITAYNGGYVAFTVPDVINSITPTGIGSKCFIDSDVVHIEMPESIQRIGISAFEGSNLQKIIAEGVTYINSCSFKNCYDLYEEYMPNVETVNTASFFKCSLLTDLSFRENLITISGSYGIKPGYEGSFDSTGLTNGYFPKVTYCNKGFDNTPLKSANLPECINLNGGFYNCTQLESVNIPKVTRIGYRAFGNCFSLPEEMDFSNIWMVEAYGFMEAPFSRIDLPNCEYLYSYCFDDSYAREINAPLIKDRFPTITSSHLEYINLENIENANTLDNPQFINCTALKYIYAPRCATVPAYYLTMEIEEEVEKGKVTPALEFIYAPVATEFGTKYFTTEYCPNFKFIYCPNLEIMKGNFYYPENSNFTFFFSDKLSDAHLAARVKYKIIAPSSTYAQSFSDSTTDYSDRTNGMNFIDSNTISFSAIDGDNFVYTCEKGDTIRFPVWLVEKMWEENIPANKGTDFITHGYLLDVNNDGIINGKDYGKIHHTNKWK